MIMTPMLMLIVMVLIGDCNDDGDAKAGGGDDEWSLFR